MNEGCLFSLLAPNYTFLGLSYGNTASMQSSQLASRPKKGALQAIALMRSLLKFGSFVCCVPPQVRPSVKELENFGYTLKSQEDLDNLWLSNPMLASAIFSNSSVWMANSGLFLPAADSRDRLTHLVPANLSYTLHRYFEARYHTKVFQKIFENTRGIQVHEPLCRHNYYSDEGAANHMRLAPPAHGDALHLFVWGRDPEKEQMLTHFPARQSLWASQQIEQIANLNRDDCFYPKQRQAVIDEGVFHNDVIAMSHYNFLCVHEEAYEDQFVLLDEIKTAFRTKFDNELIVITISKEQMSVKEAVETYFFNSHFVSTEEGVVMLAPKECEKQSRVQNILSEWIADPRIPVKRLEYHDLSQSMRNGGGPACLRLRMQLTPDQEQSLYPSFIMSPKTLDHLETLIENYYPDSVKISDLRSYVFYKRSYEIYHRLYDYFQLDITRYE